VSGPSGAVFNSLRHRDDLGLRVAVVDSLTKAFGFGLEGIQGEKTRLIGVIFEQHKNRRVPNADKHFFFNYYFPPLQFGPRSRSSVLRLRLSEIMK